jgi:hypothetical protein
MRRSLLRYTRVLFLPLLAAGLVLTGCDSTGSNGGDGNDDQNTFVYPSSSYETATVANLLAFDLGVRTQNASDNTESALIDRYTGAIDDKTIRAAQNLTTEGQSVYSDIQGGVDLSSLVSTDDLLQSSQLEAADSPSPGSPVNTDELLRHYFEQAGANDVAPATSNGIVLNQFAEKMLLGTPIWGQGAAILSGFANGTLTGNQAEQWDAAFGYFGFPRTLEPFLNYSGGTEGLAGGPTQDIDGNGAVDLTSEYVHTWAAYAIERSAAAANNGQPNDFARRAFDALVAGRQDIENGNDPSDHARTALDAWEKVVAVNVIHYINSMQGNLEGTSGTLGEGDVGEDAWGEAKAFAWGLQFYNDKLTDAQLNDVLENIGNDPPYGELTAEQYTADLTTVKETLRDAYGFDSSNVAAW